jgi:hypothetical protein
MSWKLKTLLLALAGGGCAFGLVWLGWDAAWAYLEDHEQDPVRP